MLNNYLSSVPIGDLLAEPETLAVMPFYGLCDHREEGRVDTGMALFDQSNTSEVWSVNEPIAHGISGKTHWRKTKSLIFATYWLNDADCAEIERSVSDAYMSIMSLLNDNGFSHPFRFWNYLPDINTGNGDDEVYKRFCTGRLDAFERLGMDVDSFPAASALGHHTKGAVIYVLASNSKPQHFKNTQQVNAYDYPRVYGVSSPSFARATAVKLRGVPYLFISGTASILGHKTIATGDLERQLEVTSENIEYLLSTANPDNLSLATLKVYLRHPEHYEQTKQWLSKRYPNIAVVITHADICRADLLVEIECFCR